MPVQPLGPEAIADAATTVLRVRDGMIGGEDLTPLKARILLMLALTKTQSPADIQRMFTEY